MRARGAECGDQYLRRRSGAVECRSLGGYILRVNGIDMNGISGQITTRNGIDSWRLWQTNESGEDEGTLVFFNGCDSRSPHKS